MIKMRIELWNKTSEINGVPAEHFLKNNIEFTMDDVFLVYNESGLVERIESVATIKSILGLPVDTSFEDLVAAYEEWRTTT
jgi:hypothetical protein